MQRPSDVYRHNINTDAYDEPTLKTCEEIGLQQQPKHFNSESLNLQSKYGKSHLNNTNHDTGDLRHVYQSVFSERLKNRMQSDNRNVKPDLNAIMNSVMNMAANKKNNNNVGGINSCNSTIAVSPVGGTADIMNAGGKHWKNLTKRMSLHATRPSMIAHQDESDSNDTDTLNSERSPTAVHYKASPRTDSTSKASSRSFNDDLYNESMSSGFSVLAKKSSTMLLDSKASNQTQQVLTETRFRRSSSTTSANNWPQGSEINLIMMLGLLIGLFISKILQYLLSYFGWFQYQVLHLRNLFLGHNCSLWEFCNFEDTSRYCVRTKILLLPLVGTCSLLYGLSSVLHVTIRCLLTQAPSSMIVFIQRLYLDS